MKSLKCKVQNEEINALPAFILHFAFCICILNFHEHPMLLPQLWHR